MNGENVEKNAANNSSNVTPNARPTSAVGAGFNVEKIGKKQKKLEDKKKKTTKKSKNQKHGQNSLQSLATKFTKKSKDSSESKGSSTKEPGKRPLWFWIVLGVLAAAVVGAIIWAIVMLANSSSIPGIELEVPAEGDEANNDAVANYVTQLQQIYDANKNAAAEAGESEDSTHDASAEEVSKIVEKALKSSQNSSQAGAIRLAELSVSYQNSNYDRAMELLEQINPDELSFQDQIAYYGAAQALYEQNGDSDKAKEASTIVDAMVRQSCNEQECKE